MDKIRPEELRQINGYSIVRKLAASFNGSFTNLHIGY